MELFTDTNGKTARDLVRQGYNESAELYTKLRREEYDPELEILVYRLKPGDRILDLGCGAGIPNARFLSSQYQVTGLDISEKQIELAKQNVPQAQFFCMDFSQYDFPIDHYDAVISFYALFHVPKNEQSKLFQLIHQTLKPGGFLMISLVNQDLPSYTEKNFFNACMYFSHFSLKQYFPMLENLGFTFISVNRIGHGYNNSYQGNQDEHFLLFMQKKILS